MAKRRAASRTVRKTAGELDHASKADLDRLHVAMDAEIDTRNT